MSNPLDDDHYYGHHQGDLEDICKISHFFKSGYKDAVWRFLKFSTKKFKIPSPPLFCYTFSMSSYQNEQIAIDYSAFTGSKNGLIQQEVLFKAIKSHLPDTADAAIVDVGCGGGWLAKKLSHLYKNIYGCDFSEPLLNIAKKESPAVQFSVGDLNNRLPYEDNRFNAIILNMVLHDVKNLPNAFFETARILQPNGTLIVTVANPYYAYPVGVWKRGLIGFVLRQLPKLKLRPYFSFKNKSREFEWNGKFTAYFYTLAEYLSFAFTNKFQLVHYEDIEIESDSNTFDLKYQLHRFPTILLLVFKKSAE